MPETSKFNEAAAKAEGKFEAAKEKISGYYDQLKDTEAYGKAEEVLDNAKHYVRTNPVKAVLISAGIGFALGFLFRRRD
jgi:ElaB/YqjD/DUF883 family membrane-anchored ribosome-binding protein